MNIEKIEAGYTNIVNIGRFANFVYLNKTGVYMTVDEIYATCQHFNYVVVLGDEPLSQKDELAKLFKKLAKDNPYVKLEVHTKGTIKPTEIMPFKDNVIFNVFVQMKNSGIPWDKRINDTVLSWFAEFGSNFIFKINSIDEIDEVVNITSSFGVKKSQVFLTSLININDMGKHARFYGFNLAPIVEW
jgi:hypothetical protein